MTSMAILSRTRPLIKNVTQPYDFSTFKSITTFTFLSQEAQLVESSPPPTTTTSLPPNPASGSPLYKENWRSPFAAAPPSLAPIGYFLQTPSYRMDALSETLDVQNLMNVFADWMTSQRWAEIKQLFESWIRSLDNNGAPNRPDVNLYNHYLRANLMLGALAGDLLELVTRMEEYKIVPNTASFNLVLKAMSEAGEVTAAEKLIERMLLTGNEDKESLPDDESYALVIGMLLQGKGIDAALKYIDLTLKSGYILPMDVFGRCVKSCIADKKLDTLVSIIERCLKTDQNKALCPRWIDCNVIADIAMQADNSDLAYYAMRFLARWIARGENARPPVLLSVNEGLFVSALATAGRTYSSKLLDASWEILKHSLRQKKPNPESYLAKIYAQASLGNLQKAFGTLHELETTYGSSSEEATEDLFSPFTSLNPLVLACSRNGFVTLDSVYYQLENLSKADPPYKSVAALNCVILGCANIWDVDRAYQTFEAINATFDLDPDIHSYNSLICAFGKLGKRDEATKVFEHFVSLGVKPNATTYSLLVDSHLTKRDPKAALSMIDDMVSAGYEPSKEMLKKVRRRCIREMDYDSDVKVNSLAKRFKIWMGREARRDLLFNLEYSTEYQY